MHMTSEQTESMKSKLLSAFAESNANRARVAQGREEARQANEDALEYSRQCARDGVLTLISTPR